jgi:choline-glycine betaine transporter
MKPTSQIALAIPLMLIILMMVPSLAKALIRETSIGYAQLDKEKKCDNFNTNAIKSCFK